MAPISKSDTFLVSLSPVEVKSGSQAKYSARVDEIAAELRAVLAAP